MSNTPAPPDRAAPSWRSIAALLIVAAITLSLQLGRPALVDPDEGRNAEVAREILVLHDWITPHYDFMPYLDKPIGLFWMAAASFRIFGVSEFAARLPSLVASLVCLLVAVDLSRRRRGAAAALWTGLVLATMPMFAVFARTVIFDMPLAASVAVVLWVVARAPRPGEPTSMRDVCLAGAAAGAGLLIKGPIAIALTLMIAGPALWWTGGLARWLDRRVLIGIALLIAIAVPWYVLAELRNPGYLRYFIVEEHLARFATPRFVRTQPWYFYLLVVLAGAAPWAVTLWAAARDAMRTRRDPLTVLLVMWTVAPMLFFSLSRSKQPGYIVPILPALAVLSGDAIAATLQRVPRSRWPLAASWLLWAMVLAAIAACLTRPDLIPAARGYVDLIADVRPIALPLFATAAGLAAIAAGLSLTNARGACFLTMSACLALAYLGALRMSGPWADRRSTRALVTALAADRRTNDRVAIAHPYLAGLPFYLRLDRPAVLVSPLNLGTISGSWYIAEYQPRATTGDAAIVDDEMLAREWRRADGRLLLFVEDARRDRLREALTPTPRVLMIGRGVTVFANR